MAAEQPILGTDLVTAERVPLVERRYSIEAYLIQQRQAGARERKGCVHAADAVALGGAHVEQIVVVQLEIHADLRVFDGLALFAGRVTRSTRERSRLINAVVDRVPRDARTGRHAPLCRHPVSRLSIEGQLLIGGTLI